MRLVMKVTLRKEFVPNALAQQLMKYADNSFRHAVTNIVSHGSNVDEQKSNVDVFTVHYEGDPTFAGDFSK